MGLNTVGLLLGLLSTVGLLLGLLRLHPLFGAKLLIIMMLCSCTLQF